jgi:hypothetical protein
VMALDITPPARLVRRCRECRRATYGHAEDCVIARAEAGERARREAAELEQHLRAVAAFEWRSAIAMVAGALAIERTERGVSVRAWLVWGLR